MITAKKEYSKEEIAEVLQRHLAELGMTEEVLSKEVRDGLSVNDLLISIVSDVVAAVKEREKEDLRQRQREGMLRAQEQGVVLGRPSKRSDSRFERIRARYENKDITAEEATRRMSVSISTFYRWLRQSRNADVETVTED